MFNGPVYSEQLPSGRLGSQGRSLPKSWETTRRTSQSLAVHCYDYDMTRTRLTEDPDVTEVTYTNPITQALYDSESFGICVLIPAYEV